MWTRLRIRSSEAGKRLAIVGGGYIGLEVAAVAAKRGLDVTVFEAMDRVMARAVSRPVSDFFEQVHRAAGVKLLLNTGVEAFEGNGKLEARARRRQDLSGRSRAGRHRRRARTSNWHKDAGPACEDGIVVDENCA